MDSETDKIAQAAETCLGLAIRKSDPYKRVSACLKSLQLVEG
jgi:hypothetical protein